MTTTPAASPAAGDSSDSSDTSDSPASTHLILGCGYIGVRLGRALRKAGDAVVGTRRGEGGCRELAAEGIEAIPFDVADVEGESDLFARPFHTVVYALAPGRGAPRTEQELVFARGAAACAKRLVKCPPRRFILLSSTGVYGQDGGEWVDETSPAEPTTPRHRWIRAGEDRLLETAAAAGVPAVVLRLGGLYGPGRSPVDWCRDERMRQRLQQTSAEAFMNWIHADDAVAGICSGMERSQPGEIYLIVDGVPVVRRDFYELATELGESPPLALRSDPARRSKRCSNRKAREHLGFALRFPSYREGLASLV